MNKGDKKGSHVEVMISFIIFIAFVLFLLAILVPPIGTQKDKAKIFQGIEIGIANIVSSNLTAVTVNIGDIGDECVNLDNFLVDTGIEGNIIVKNSEGETAGSNINADSLQIIRSNTGDKFFKIYYSPEFGALSTGEACSVINYSIGLQKTSEYIFESKFIELMSESLQTVRGQINVPDGIGFGYGIILSNGTTIETSEGELKTNVYVKETPIEYVDIEGNIMEGYIKTKIW